MSNFFIGKVEASPAGGKFLIPVAGRMPVGQLSTKTGKASRVAIVSLPSFQVGKMYLCNWEIVEAQNRDGEDKKFINYFPVGEAGVMDVLSASATLGNPSTFLHSAVVDGGVEEEEGEEDEMEKAAAVAAKPKGKK